jgi:G3E family GTPase
VVKSVSSVAPVLVLVGGFPGAGKTTLVIEAARRLAARGLRVAFVSNDQAGDLVDTALARAADLMTAEVAGGCFCCRLSDLLSATETLLASHPDVIFAEPVSTRCSPIIRDAFVWRRSRCWSIRYARMR